jgi:hypothetical protein
MLDDCRLFAASYGLFREDLDKLAVAVVMADNDLTDAAEDLFNDRTADNILEMGADVRIRDMAYHFS